MSNVRGRFNNNHHASFSQAHYNDESSNDQDDDDFSSEDEEDDDGTFNDDIGYRSQSNSGSESLEYASSGHGHHPIRNQHTRSEHHQGSRYRTPSAPRAAMSTPSEDYSYPRTTYSVTQGYFPPQSNMQGAPYQPAHGAYSQYGGRGGQMVPAHGYGNPNPFAPMAPANPYYQDPRGSSHDMVPMQQPPYYPPGPHPGYMMTPYMYANNGPPPPTDVATRRHTPAPPEEKKPDPEMERIKKQLELLQAEKKAKEDEIKEQQRKEIARQEAEQLIQLKIEQANKARAEQLKEMERVRQDVERAARERMEAEKKAEEAKKRQHEEALARMEEQTRAKIEAERRAEEERRKREAEAAAAAEAAMKLKIEAAEAKAKALAKAEAEAEVAARAAAAKKVQEELEFRKKIEEEAKLKAELDARKKFEDEKKAAEAARIAEEEKKKEEKALKEKIMEEARNKIEEQNKKKELAPVKFKDALGRKFNFPYHLCKTWQGMEELIKQAFVQIDFIGTHVQEGHYDLIGPNGEIILPSIWEKVVQPDWAVTMQMWPMDKLPALRRPIPGGAGAMPGAGMPGANMPMPGGQFPMGGAARPGFPGRPMSGMGGMPSTMPFRPAGAPQNGQPWPPNVPMGGGAMPRPVNIVEGDIPSKHHHSKKTSKTTTGGLLAFIGGKQTKHKKRRN